MICLATKKEKEQPGISLLRQVRHFKILTPDLQSDEFTNLVLLWPFLMAWMVSDSREWIHLKRVVAPWRVWPNRSMWTLHHALQWDGRLVESQEGLEANINLGRSEYYSTLPIGECKDGGEPIKEANDEFSSIRRTISDDEGGLCPWNPIVALYVGIEAALVYLDSLRLPSSARTPHINSRLSECREARRYPTQPQLT
ncbi:hypothetical protein M9H77_31371 [Catharanthus roseus]|uniref:Uncharacterized protein n=1 Tax=Catharanthus roseus TaxID=4058 RepID=A0ACC0A0Q7_CATRO|nr:hypothetical protein M9H77_31371 [Catharanthus roseus]